MTHGFCASIGCLAMNDYIDEIYTVVSTAATRGQAAIPVHIVPFPLTEENIGLANAVWPEHTDFWTQELAPAWRAFEAADVKQVPQVDVDTSSGVPAYKYRA
jgi:murein L,D-transpeptidase YafK